MTPSLKHHYKRLKIRSLVIQAIRDFFTENSYLEVETPIRCPSIIPEAQIDPIMSEEQYLQSSPELCMKRMLSGGFDNIFQICKCFRKNERSQYHLPELTMLEWYSKNKTYVDLMTQCEALIQFIAEKLDMGSCIRYQHKTIQLDKQWQRITVDEAFRLYADTSVDGAVKDNRFDDIISFQIEPHLGNTTPAFLYNYPIEYASLAKQLNKNRRYAQRFELYIAGVELANGFTELTDPTEQKQRFTKENHIRTLQGAPPLPMPERFLKDLESMPDASGIALGIDRLVMVFSNALSIDEVVAFTPETL